MITDDEIQTLEEAFAGASGPPWESHRGWEQGDPGVYIASETGGGRGGQCVVYADDDVMLAEKDADLVCLAVNAAPGLIARLRATEKELAELKHARDVAFADMDLAYAQAKAEQVKHDNPEYDGTDGAHPAWWRGHEHGFASVVSALADIVAGTRPVGVARADYQALREAIWTMREKHRITSECIADLEKVDPMTAQWIRGYCQIETVESSVMGQILPIVDRGKHKRRCPRCNVISTDAVTAHTIGCPNGTVRSPVDPVHPLEVHQPNPVARCQPGPCDISILTGECRVCGRRVVPRSM